MNLLRQSLLQTQVLRVGQVNEPYIRVNIRELNEVLSTMYPPLYTNY